MTKRLETPPPPVATPPQEEDPLSNKLMEILKERETLQLRTKELAKMVQDSSQTSAERDSNVSSFRNLISVNGSINGRRRTLNRWLIQRHWNR